ncbi:MAG TPA: aminopeptidase P family protein [Rickettsiales bacterium]|nr:aminopeptidase P family protein [Rickettsiales bacterium]
MTERIAALRGALRQQGMDGFILPVNDEFMGEYVPDSAKRLEWLTGFSGSAGLAIVLQDKAAFFTDGRYTLQAETQVKGFELYNSGDMPPEKWLAAQAGAESIIGYDARLHTKQAIKRYETACSKLVWKALQSNPVDVLWQGRPAAPASKARIQPLAYTGQTSQQKREMIAAALKEKGADSAVLTAPDSICWLLNLRGSDVPFTPFLLCYAVIDAKGVVDFYIASDRLSQEVLAHLGDGVRVKPPQQLEQDIAALKGKRVLYDPAASPIWFYQQLASAGAHIVEFSDPCHLPKACKNEAELEGMRQAHIRDGLAVTRFLHWLEQAVASGEALTEIAVAQKLEAFRKQSELYLEPSFSTISGSGPNGAIVHYHATESSNRALDKDSLLLVDSGGQYLDGTTDITRTVALGTPSAQMKADFTRVLKGHIALASAVFPEGTSGGQLDVLARQYLWQAGLDYDHGTGHGVGSYLSVHEGPQRIGKRGGDAPLVPGMVVSNEPGFYKANAYGIRIESLVAVRQVMVGENGKAYLGFETITLAPLDMRLVDTALLTLQEVEWLHSYHRRVYETHERHLNDAEKAWLKRFAAL